MGKIIYYVAASLDGYIADADGGVDWLPEGDVEGYGYEELYSGVDALVMGRRTYDQAVGFDQWLFSDKPVYVFTSHPPDDNPHDVEFVSSTLRMSLHGQLPRRTREWFGCWAARTWRSSSAALA